MRGGAAWTQRSSARSSPGSPLTPWAPWSASTPARKPWWSASTPSPRPGLWSGSGTGRPGGRRWTCSPVRSGGSSAPGPTLSPTGRPQGAGPLGELDPVAPEPVIQRGEVRQELGQGHELAEGGHVQIGGLLLEQPDQVPPVHQAQKG